MVVSQGQKLDMLIEQLAKQSEKEKARGSLHLMVCQER